MKNKNCRIYNKDSLLFLPKIKEKVHAVIADPPYDYDIIGKAWNQKELERRLSYANSQNHKIKYIPYGNARRGGVRNKKWFERELQNIEEYIQFSELWIKAAYSCLHPGGYIAIFCSTTSVGHIQRALESQNFFVKEIISLVKPSNVRKGITLHQSKTRRGLSTREIEKTKSTVLNNLVEFVVVAHKPFSEKNTSYLDQWLSTKTGFIDNKWLPSNVISCKRESISKDLHHINRKPLDVMKSLVGGLCPKGGTVLDPFAGSGTTGVACLELKRKCILVEKEVKYCKIILKRVSSVPTR